MGNVAKQNWVGILCCAICSFSVNACHKKKPTPPPPLVVHVITLEPTNVPIYKEWIGTLQGNVNAQIRAEVSGYLLTQNYREGSVVKKGQLLFQIDPRPFEALLEQANGKLAQDQAQQSRTQWNVERYAPLAKQNAISQQEYNDAVQANLAALAQLKADQAAVQAAELNLQFTKISSPIEGLAGMAQAQIGDLVGPSGPILTTVSDINPIKVYFNATEQDYLAYTRLHTNPVERAIHERELRLELILTDGSVYPERGHFYFAGREINPTTGTIQLAGLFPNADYVLRPGQFARIRAVTQMRTNAVVVPQRAVTELQGTYEVATVDAEDRVQLQPITVGVQFGANWLVEKGLHIGQRVIVEGTQKAKQGMKVNPQPFKPPTQTQ